MAIAAHVAVPEEAPTSLPGEVSTAVPVDTPAEVPASLPLANRVAVAVERPVEAPTRTPGASSSAVPVDVPAEAPDSATGDAAVPVVRTAVQVLVPSDCPRRATGPPRFGAGACCGTGATGRGAERKSSSAPPSPAGPFRYGEPLGTVAGTGCPPPRRIGRRVSLGTFGTSARARPPPLGTARPTGASAGVPLSRARRRR